LWARYSDLQAFLAKPEMEYGGKGKNEFAPTDFLYIMGTVSTLNGTPLLALYYSAHDFHTKYKKI